MKILFAWFLLGIAIGLLIALSLLRKRNKMQEAVECKVKYTCNLCGRNNFDAPSPHKCRGGFRKRGLTWSITFRSLALVRA